MKNVESGESDVQAKATTPDAAPFYVTMQPKYEKRM